MLLKSIQCLDRIKVLLAFVLLATLDSCAYKNIGEHGPNTTIVTFTELPKAVQDAYQNEFIALTMRSMRSPVSIINLDAKEIEFKYHKSTTISIIKPGKIIYKIGKRSFYVPWNSNRELTPHILYEKMVFSVYATTPRERVFYHDLQTFKSNRYVKVDLSKHLKY